MRVSLIALTVCATGLSALTRAQSPIPEHSPISQAADAPIKITVTGPATAAANSEIKLHIVLTNTSTTDAVGVPTEVNDSDAEWNYTITVVNENGNIPQDTEYGVKARRGPDLLTRTFLELEPGKSFEETFFLNKLFILVPGQTYHVQVQHHNKYSGTKNLTAKSNIFTIAITQ